MTVLFHIALAISNLPCVPQVFSRSHTSLTGTIPVSSTPAPTRAQAWGSYNVGEMTPLLRRQPPEDLVREAAWIARCIGRSDTVPLREADLAALASYLSPEHVAPGTVLFRAGEPS